MNTAAVAKELGVSTSTIKRWVKQLGLSMKKNDMGHFCYKEEDIETLRAYQHQSEAFKVFQEIAVAKDSRVAMVQVASPSQDSPQLIHRITALEQLLSSKADQVVAYQLLQHRREINELTEVIENLQERIKVLEAYLIVPSNKDSSNEDAPLPRRAKKNGFMSRFLGLFRKHSS